MRGKVALFVGLLLAGLALANVPSAAGTSNDDIFIGVIDEEGIPYSSRENAIGLAHAICEYVSAGQAPEQVAIEISEPANWTVEQSGFFVGAATQVYCPGSPAPVQPITQPVMPLLPPTPPAYVPVPAASYFPNCTAARSAGAAPLYAGQAGYRSGLDRDGDGIACE